MEAHYTKRFLASYADASPSMQRAVDRRVALLLSNLRHPSLRAKKYDETQDIWQARVTGSWRLYFQIVGETYYLLDVIPHPK
jgi:mRNA-degrading endonuclease RelE of RelBE toxin-antitoxin system